MTTTSLLSLPSWFDVSVLLPKTCHKTQQWIWTKYNTRKTSKIITIHLAQPFANLVVGSGDENDFHSWAIGLSFTMQYFTHGEILAHSNTLSSTNKYEIGPQKGSFEMYFDSIYIDNYIYTSNESHHMSNYTLKKRLEGTIVSHFRNDKTNE